MLASENTKASLSTAKIQEILSKKNHGKDVEHYLDIAKKLGRSIYEVLCEIEKVVSYDDLAMVFQECSDLPLSEDIGGEILGATHNVIETSHGLYIWHFASYDALAANGKKVFLATWASW